MHLSSQQSPSLPCRTAHSVVFGSARLRSPGAGSRQPARLSCAVDAAYCHESCGLALKHGLPLAKYGSLFKQDCNRFDAAGC